MPILYKDNFAIFLFPERIKDLFLKLYQGRNVNNVFYGYILENQNGVPTVYTISSIQKIDDARTNNLSNKFTLRFHYVAVLSYHLKYIDIPLGNNSGNYIIYLPDKNIITRLFNQELKPKNKLDFVKPTFAKEGIYNLIAYGGAKLPMKIINLIDKFTIDKFIN